jgi:hypothetical protein
MIEFNINLIFILKKIMFVKIFIKLLLFIFNIF